MIQLALPIEDVYRNENHAEFNAGQVQIDDLDAIGQINAEPIACFEAPARQQLRQAVTAGVDIAEGVRSGLKFESQLIASADQREIKEVEEVQKVKVTRCR